MSQERPLWRVRCRAVWDFVYHVVAAVLGIISRVLWGIIDSLLSLLG